MKQPIGRRLALMAAAMIMVSAAPVARPEPVQSADPLQTKVDGIRDRFVAAVRACGVTPAFVPRVDLETGPAVIAYESRPRRLVIGRYEALPPPIKAFFVAWTAHDMPGTSPAFLFDDLFNGFLVGHELGHWVDDLSGRLSRLDHYDAEIEANRIAIAFAGLRPGDRAAQEAKVRAFSYLGTLPDPVPAGEDPRRWFDSHYDDLAQTNPLAYNWFQGLFMRTAWADHDQHRFCSLVRLKPGDPA